MSEIKQINKVVASFAQKRIWFLDSFDPNNPAYNVVYFWQITGEFSLPILQRSINFLINKHTSLRTNFSAASGELQQCINESCDLVVKDVITHDLETEMSVFAKQIFDLKKMPLFAVSVFKCTNGENILGFNFHHIICDGWSLEILFKELSEVYAAYNAGYEPTLPNTSKSYSDYSLEESALLASIEDEALNYWKCYLKDIPQLALPTDFPRPAVQSFDGQREIMYLDREITDLLKLKAKESNSSLYHILLSAYMLLMKIYSGQNDLVAGTPVANRGDFDFRDTFGLFVNSIVIRCNIDSNNITTFKDLLGLVKSNFLESLEYQAYPFERVVEHIQPDRSLSHNPLFQNMFALQDGNGKVGLVINGNEAISVDGKLGNTRFDIECTTWDKPEGIKIRINYNVSLYDRVTILSMINCYIAILTKIAKSEFSELNINVLANLDLPENCKSRLLGDKEELPNQTIASLIFENKNANNNTAISCGKENINFKDLEHKTHQIASHIASLIANKNSVGKVVVMLKPSIEMAVIISAILRTNLTLIPINPDDPEKRRERILSLTNPDLVICDGMDILEHRKITADVLITQAISQVESEQKYEPCDLNDIAYVIHTSGTTGEPKGVQVTHGQLLNTIIGASKFLKLNQDDVFASWSSFSFDIFYLEFLLPLLSGAELKLVANEELFAPDIIISLLEKVTCIHGVPGLMHQLIDNVANEKIYLSNIRYALTGGDLVPPALFERMSIAFPNSQNFVLYGPTETTIICMRQPYTKHKHVRYIIGQPMINVEVKICDNNDNILPRGAVGEIVIGGNGVSNGYVLDHALNAEKFINIDGAKYYKTGDKGKLAFDDTIEFFGRDDSQVKLRGFRINLNEISSVLNTHHQIDNAVTILHKKNDQEQYIVSYVVPKALNSDQDITLLNTWTHLFDNTHKEHKQSNEADFSGWISAIDSKPLNPEIMNDWLNSTIHAITSEIDQQKMDNKNLRVLEIGCGTGLVLFKILNLCSEYIGTDISAEILYELQNKIDKKHNDKVKLVHCSAENTLKYVQGQFDLIIMNSVSQYFPNKCYLTQVLSDLNTLLSDNGIIFVGDIRSLHLSKHFYRRIADFQVKSGALESEDINSFISAKEFFDNELLISPLAFTDISSNLGLQSFISPRLDSYESELAVFRYNAIFTRHNLNNLTSYNHYQWNGYDEFKQLSIEQSNNGNVFVVDRVPNRRVNDGNDSTPSIIDINVFIESVGLKAKFSWSKAYSGGEFDVIVAKDFKDKQHYHLSADIIPGVNACSDPSGKAQLRTLEKELLEHLGNNVPRYMVPRQIEFIDSIPLGLNNKVNVNKLPSPRLLKYDSEYIAPENNLQKVICQSWSDILGLHRIGINDNFFKLGGTSLLAIQAAIHMRKRSINLRPQVLFKCQTPKELADFILKEQAGNIIDASMVQSDRDSNEFAKTTQLISPSKLDLSRVLIFGSTGFLGAHLLGTLLQDPYCKEIYCIVRDTTIEDAKNRLFNTLKIYMPDINDSLLDKVNILCGNMSDSYFQVNETTLDFLQNNINTIINAAANVSHVGKQSAFIKDNIEGVQNIINFASIGIKKKIIHISTIGVKGISPRIEPFTETDLDVGQTMTEYYSESKLKAEIILNSYIKNGGDVLIFRVGTIAPNSRGIFQKNIQSHFFSRYIKSILSLGIAPKWDDRHLSLTPVDFMAEAVLAIAAENRTDSTYHINTDQNISYALLAKWLINYGYGIKILEHNQFNENIEKVALDSNVSHKLDGLIQLLDTSNVKHHKLSTSLTKDVLDECKMSYPATTEEWFRKFIDYAVRANFIPQAESVLVEL